MRLKKYIRIILNSVNNSCESGKNTAYPQVIHKNLWITAIFVDKSDYKNDKKEKY